MADNVHNSFPDYFCGNPKDMPFTLRPLNTVEDALRHFIQVIDLDMVKMLLDTLPEEDPGDHDRLLIQLDRAFGYFKSQGDEQLNVIQGKCRKCYPKSQGFMFVGNKSKAYMFLLFYREGSGILSIFECDEFKTPIAISNSNKRVYLNEYKFRTETLGEIDEDHVPF